MKTLDRLIDEAKRSGFKYEIVNAPKEALTFDKLLVLRREGAKFIQSVMYYNSKTDKVVNFVR